MNYLIKKAKNSFRKKKVEKLAADVSGIENIELINASIHGGQLYLSQDSQIIFSVKLYLTTSCAIAQIILAIESCDPEASPKIYLDYGVGFSEETAFFLEKLTQTEEKWTGYIVMPQMLKRIRLDITELEARVKIASIIVQRAALTSFVARFMDMGTEVATAVASQKAAAAVSLLSRFFALVRDGNEPQNHSLLATAVSYGFHKPVSGSVVDKTYLSWIERNEAVHPDDRVWMRAQYASWNYNPLISIVMPVFDPPLSLLNEAICSLKNQLYENWELCIADDASRNQGVRELLSSWSQRDQRIRVVYRTTRGHISNASNSAASIARGDFILLMDNDDLLPEHALWTLAYYINKNSTCDIFYSDEDKIGTDGFRRDPYNKGAFDRFLMYGHNMFSHLGVYRRSLFTKIGGFREGYEGSQDYDLVLRCMEEVGEDRIVHIPHVLYHWRQIPGSTALDAGEKSYAFEAAKRVLNEHYQRCGYPLEAIDSGIPGISAVRTLSTAKPAVVSVIIPTRDSLDVLRSCIDSLLAAPDPLMEIVVVDNGSDQGETMAYLDGLGRDSHRFKRVRLDEPFNFSRLCNLGVEHASGEIVCLLNNDTEVLAPGMFERVRAWLSIPDVGVVGGRLLYPDGTIQHFGVHTGVGPYGIAEHCYSGLPDAVHTNFSKSQLLQQFVAVTAACLFMRKRDYLLLGGCDEAFPVAFNDVDLCFRVRRHGLKVICDPAIRLCHKESKSRGRDITLEKKARLKQDAMAMMDKWGEEGLRDPFYSSNFATAHATFAMSLHPNAPLPWKKPRAEA